MSNKSSSDIISLPKGGGAMNGIGEKFSPDLHTGTGNFTIPIAIPPGRNGFQPQLNLVYSTGNSNGPFGLGWNLSIPGISRKTSKGVPRYDDAKDVFILSGAEDLVPVQQEEKATHYRPRTEGLFAKILYHHDATNNFWEVRSKDGLVSFYGTAASFGSDPAVIENPSNRKQVFSWKLSNTEDPFGNRIIYQYERDTREEGPRHWDQLYLSSIQYVDHGTNPDHPLYLVTIEFVYELRPDPHSGYRSGFEICTRKRCTHINVHVNTGNDQLVRTYELVYLDKRHELAGMVPVNGASLLSQVIVTGYDGDRSEKMPPLEFRYTGFHPGKRNFFPLQGTDLPARSLADPDLELVDLFGNGLPDLIEMNGTVRYWRNLGEGRFDHPRFMRNVPAGLALSDAGIQFIDANGDGRTDLLVTNDTMSGFFPLSSEGAWDEQSFRRYNQAPSFNLKDPEVKLVDLDGDGITDAIRSGSRMEYFFNDPKEGWNNTKWNERQTARLFPDVNFSDPRVKWADLTGDGLQNILLVHNGNIEYWPNLGYGNWGKRISMRHSPRFPFGYDPKRILIGDADGDGLDDIIYVDDSKIILWINKGGYSWSDPITIKGTPPVSDMDAVRLVDLLGNGISGVLWSRDADSLSGDHFFFLDFIGGMKPYLLSEMNNHIGAVTKVEYAPSIHFYLADQKLPATRWKTALPFPVHIVARLEVIDHFSRGRLTTEYRYHHGYWDGTEREFRGFGMVEQLDSESFENYDSSGVDDAQAFIDKIDQQYFSPPTMNRTWFHQGPVGEEFGDWQEHDNADEYWPGDAQFLQLTNTINQFLGSEILKASDRRSKRDALRTLRGSILRTELYALDSSERENRPYVVSESSYALIEIDPPEPGDQKRLHIFYPHVVSQRTTQWERGDDPMTECTFTSYLDKDRRFDPFGRPLSQTQIACPRGWRNGEDKPIEPYLATRTCTVYSKPIDKLVYIHDRVAKATSYEIANSAGKSIMQIATISDLHSDLKLIGQTLNYYDGDAFVGEPLQRTGRYGAITRTESLVLTDEILQRAYGTDVPPYLKPEGNTNWTDDYPEEFRLLLPSRAGYTFHAGSTEPDDAKGYFATTSRQRYDFQTNSSRTGRGLLLEILDPLHDATANPAGHRILIEYDEYQLLVKKVIDAAGLSVLADYDYRVQKPNEIIDANNNKNRFTFSPLGLLESSSVLGKTSTEGDQQRASVRMEYEFLAFENSHPENRQPIFARSIRHIHHDTELDIPLPLRNETITTVEYSDGFGRLLQTRTQGEELRFGGEHFGGGDLVLPAKQSERARNDVTGRSNTDELNPNVVVSGWQIYNNKGLAVEKYEPFFSEGWNYAQPDDTKKGQKATMFYDPRGHTIRTLNPDGSEQRVIFGVPGIISKPDLAHPDSFEPTPWEAYTFDANDNAGRTHPANSTAYEHHFNTPGSILIDSLGRIIETIARNREQGSTLNGSQSPIVELRTQTSYDIRGNVLTVTDALERPAFRDQVHDYANTKLSFISIDAGQRKMVSDAAGNIIEQRDSKGSLTLQGYDDLNRPVRLWARDSNDQQLTQRERMEYGDAGNARQPEADRAAHQAANRLGKLSRYFDEAGLLNFENYDFKGNLLNKTRRVVSDAAILDVFNRPSPTFKIDAFRVDWTNVNDAILDNKIYASTISYDALNRAKKIIYPEDVENRRRQIVPHYNHAGTLDHVSLDEDTFVEHIAYNAKGQRVMITYGNGIMTRYAYDPQSFRLLHLRTERYNKLSDILYRPAGSVLQDLAYEFDLVGNILQLHDRTPGCGIINTSLGADALDRLFTYDALYRLRLATGRECDQSLNFPWNDSPRCADKTKTTSYIEQYVYDLAGNIEQLKHLSNAIGFTRDLKMVSGNNQLRDMTVAENIFDYAYDANGNMIRETTSRHFEWDHADRMRVYRTQADANEPSVHAHYLYDASGQRTKKLVRKQGGQVDATVYIDGVFEYQRIVRNGTIEENNTLHILDNHGRVALVRIGTPFINDTTPAVKYQLGDHLGSSNVVIDGSGIFINCEEYTPYGETSFGGFARKRYRFAAKERDTESGLYYYGARYYASWLGRWTTCDPAGTVDGLQIYAYVLNNPIGLSDPTGLQSCNDSSGGVCSAPSTNPTDTPVATDSSGGPPHNPSRDIQQTEHLQRRQPPEPEIIPTPSSGTPGWETLPHPKDATAMGQFDNAVKDTLGGVVDVALPRVLSGLAPAIKSEIGLPETPAEARGGYYHAATGVFSAVLSLGLESGKTSVAEPKTILVNSERGRKFQDSVIGFFDLPGNTTTMLGETKSGALVPTIPDVYGGGSKPFGEIKDVLKQSNSPQLQAQQSVANMTGTSWSPIFSKRTKNISSPVVNAALDSGGFVFRVDPELRTVEVFDPANKSWTPFLGGNWNIK